MKKRFKKKKIIFNFLLFFSLFLIYTNFIFIENFLLDLSDKKIIFGSKEIGVQDLQVYFCPKDDCYFEFINYLNLAESEINCALFELDEINLSKKFIEKSNQKIDISILIDGNYADEEGFRLLQNTNIKLFTDDKRSKLMHNKFCIIDERYVLTGSTNPTENGFYYNNNNLVIFESENLAKNYKNEFNQLSKGNFGKNKVSTIEFNDVFLESDNNKYLLNSYFCPQDNCLYEVLNILNNSRREILFANFVLTNNLIENLLLEKKSQGVNVTGIIEKRMINVKGSNVDFLNQSFPIYTDINSKTMHHKVFVVDNKYVITGSMNPSNNGAFYNDENLLIIESEFIANKYKEEIISLIR